MVQYRKIEKRNEPTTENEINFFGKTKYRQDDRVFGIRRNDRRRHLYILGRTGTGKSTLLENMAINDIQNGEGLCFVDPHGDAAETILKAIPSPRINDVVYFNPADTEYPIGFNPIEPGAERHLIVSNMMAVFEKIFFQGGNFASQAPQLTHILRHTLYAVMESQDSTLLSVQKMLIDEKYRNKIVKRITDPVIKQFWTVEFPNSILKRRDDPLASTLNKIGQFLTVPMLRNILGQPKSSFDLRDIMDNQKIFIVNLSKGKLGEDNSNLLGAMLITKIFIAAMSRVNIPEAERKDFYAYIDEFQNFSTESLAGILSEARKYRLSLILANQYIEQLIDTVRNAIFGNCGTIISFRIGAKDAEELEKELTPFKREDFVDLPNFNFYIREMIDGENGNAFSAVGLPPKNLEETEGNEEKVIRQSRSRYCKSRPEVEKNISNWTR